MSQTGIIILAAGTSSRLGRPKQLLTYRGISLIDQVTAAALDAALGPVIVVTGAYADDVAVILQSKKAAIVHNSRWQTGMASGIVAGLSTLLTLAPNLQNVLLTVCDQPFVTAALFRQLYEKKRETGKGIVAAAYAETLGTPMLFDAVYFDALLALTGEEGAKKLVKKQLGDVEKVSFPQGHIDIDTADDYKHLLTYPQ